MQTQLPADPFALMLNPEAVLSAVESSERLGRLKRRICRPLDKPLIATVTRDTDAFDREIDAEEPEADPEA